MSCFRDYAEYNGLCSSELVRKKELKLSELVEEAISRIERLNPQINAVIFKMYELARKAADGELPEGPMKNAPFLLKDLGIAYAGVPLTSVDS